MDQFKPGWADPGGPGWTLMDSKLSLSQSFRISNVEVLDYQLVALRTEFIFENHNLHFTETANGI